VISVYKLHTAVSLTLQFSGANYLLCRYGSQCCRPVWAQVANLPIREGTAGKGEAFKQKFLIACSAKFWIIPCGSRLVR